MYWRVLHLRHVRPNGWQRLMLFEGSVVVGIVLTLAGAATAWAVLVLPAVVAVVVKAHDLLAGYLRAGAGPPR